MSRAQEDGVAQPAHRPSSGCKAGSPHAAGVARAHQQLRRPVAPSLAAQVMGPKPAAPAPPRTLLEMLSLRPQQDQISQNLHFNKMPRDLCACQVHEGVPRNPSG